MFRQGLRMRTGAEPSELAELSQKEVVRTRETNERLFENDMRDFVPYFVSAVLAQRKLTEMERNIGIIGLFFHVATWIAIMALDIYLLSHEFTAEGSMLNMLQIAAFTTVAISGGLVILLTVFQCLLALCKRTYTWGDGLLPPFLSSAIVANVRASLEFSKFLLFFSVFQPIAEVRDSPVARNVKNILIVLIVLKYYGISMTMNNHRVKIYDDNHPVSMAMS